MQLPLFQKLKQKVIRVCTAKDEELKNIAIKNSVLNICDLLTCDDTKGYKKRKYKEEIVVLF